MHLMNGFSAGRRALICAAVLIGALAVPASAAEPIGRMHDCGKLVTGRFKVLGVGVQGVRCVRARGLLRDWLANSASPASEGFPRSRRRGHWECRRFIAWSCTVNGRAIRMVINFDLRRHGDLWGRAESAYAIGPAGETYVDYKIVVRNTGRDVVAGGVVDALPPNVTLVRVTTSQGSCGGTDSGRRVTCSLGPVRTGFGNGARVTLRVAYDCEGPDPIGLNSTAVASPSGDVDPSNNTSFVDELDPVCPDPPPEPFFDDPPPDPDPDPFTDPPPEDPPVADPPVADPPVTDPPPQDPPVTDPTAP
jgi:uncharacterized repeat protein (TIGR01451 family)